MNCTLALLGLGGGEIVLILAVVLLLFGAKKLPELAKGLGQGIREFKKASNEVTDELHRAMDDHNPPPSAPMKKLPPEGTEVRNKESVDPSHPSSTEKPS
ncbi:MAG: Twin-arginine translocation protein TatA/E [Verrucomicrobiales bacterium]|nr:Twin-arginine translocation protein TatA/E [Verrucomicrobiales bacterium]